MNSNLPSALRDQLKDLLAAMPREQRLVLLLHHADGLTLPEIAAVLELQPERVEALLARGLAVLQQAVDRSAASEAA